MLQAEPRLPEGSVSTEVSDRVLITGATGFVGSHITGTFAEAGYEVRCGLRSTSDPRWLSGLRVERVSVDLTRREELAGAVKGVNTVIHAAGITRAYRKDDYYRINAEGTRRMAAAAAESGVRRFVLISSLAARGPDASTENDRPVSPYGDSKLKAEEYLRSLEGRMETVVLRPAAVYGPRDTDLLPLFKMASKGWLPIPSSTNVLQAIYAADAARAVLAAARRSVGFGPLPLAEANRYSWYEVVTGIEKALGRTVRAIRLPAALYRLAGRVAEEVATACGSMPVFDERRARDLAVHAWTCDPSSTEKALGWRAEVSLFEGLERTAHWYRRVGWI